MKTAIYTILTIIFLIIQACTFFKFSIGLFFSSFIIYFISCSVVEHIFDKDKKYTYFQKMKSYFFKEKPEWHYATKTERMKMQYNELSELERQEFLDKICDTNQK